MKYLIFLLLLSGCQSGAQQTPQKNDCESFTKNGWRIVYNAHYKKYAVARGVGVTIYFLLKDSFGEYGVYAKGWEDKHCYTCGDKSKSLFSNPCAAKEFIIAYYKKLEQDHWE